MSRQKSGSIVSLGILCKKKTMEKIMSSFVCLKNSFICLIQVVSGNMSAALFIWYSSYVSWDAFLQSHITNGLIFLGKAQSFLGMLLSIQEVIGNTIRC